MKPSRLICVILFAGLLKTAFTGETRAIDPVAFKPEVLTDQQAEKLVGPLEKSLLRERAVSPKTLNALSQLRRSQHAKVDELLIGALKHQDPRVVMLSADAIAIHQPATAQAELIAAKTREEFGRFFGYRRAITMAVAAYQNADSVGFLVDVLPDADGQYEWLVVERLMALTGQNFANDAEGWKKWWLASKDRYRGPPSDVDAKSLREQMQSKDWSRPIPEFFDVPLFAKRIVFVIDRSKSMESTLDGETRLTRAQKELSDAITEMAEDVQFNIVAYDDQVLFWQTSLVPANIEAKSAALQYVNSIFSGNKTASYDALSRGLSFDPNTELIVFLSDGKPTAGQIIEPAAIVKQITLENTFVRATIETLGIDTEGEAELFMYDLAKNNFGNYLRIR